MYVCIYTKWQVKGKLLHTNCQFHCSHLIINWNGRTYFIIWNKHLSTIMLFLIMTS